MRLNLGLQSGENASFRKEIPPDPSIADEIKW